MISLTVIILVILILVFLKIPRGLKITYAILFSIFFLYIVNKDQILNALSSSQRESILNGQTKLYQKYLRDYKLKSPGTLEFVVARNLGHLPIYYINLDRSTERRKNMEQTFGQYGIDGVRISGIDGKKIKNLTEDEVDGIKFISFYPELTPSATGCTLSHFKAVEQAYKDGHQMAIILEDDIALDLIPHWDKTMHQIIEGFPSDWTVVNLNPNCTDLGEITSYQKKHCWSTTVYIINRKGMEAILNLKRGDTWIIKKPMHGRCNKGVADCIMYASMPGVYSYHEPLFFVKPVTSVIGNPDSWPYSLKNINKFSALKNNKSKNNKSENK